MKAFLKLLSILSLAILLMSGTVNAITIPFDDNSANWPNWSVQGDDLNGTPDFLDGTATISGTGHLTELTFRVEANKYLTGFLDLRPGDLFIDKNADETWDYIVNSWAYHGTGNLSDVNGTYDLYSVSQPLGETGGSTPTDANYILADAANFRTGHPTGLNLDEYDGELLTGSAQLSGWWDSSAQLGDQYIVKFSFGATDISLEDQFTIGFMVSCANDVVYETMSNPVPEPASMLLLGSGLIGLAGLGRKKFFE